MEHNYFNDPNVFLISGFYCIVIEITGHVYGSINCLVDQDTLILITVTYICNSHYLYIATRVRECKYAHA